MTQKSQAVVVTVLQALLRHHHRALASYAKCLYKLTSIMLMGVSASSFHLLLFSWDARSLFVGL